MGILISILTIIALFYIFTLIVSYQANKDDEERWNGGICDRGEKCTGGWYEYDGSPFWEVIRYKCQTCGHEIITGKRMDL